MSKTNVYLVIASGHEEDHVMGVFALLSHARLWMNKLKFYHKTMRDIERELSDIMLDWKDKNPMPQALSRVENSLDDELAVWNKWRNSEDSQREKKKRLLMKQHFGNSWKEFAKIPDYRFAPNHEIIRMPVAECLPQGFPFAGRDFY